MIAYNSTLLNNLLILKKSKNWFANGLITADQMKLVLEKYPANYYKPNPFVRIGLFLFTWLKIGAAIGLYSFFAFSISLSSDAFVGFGVFSGLLIAGVSFFVLENYIKTKQWFGNGIDDATLVCLLGSVLSVIGLLVNDNFNAQELVMFALFLPFLVAAAMRYLDRVATLAAVFCFYAVSFLLILEIGTVAKFIMPFALMILSAALFVVTQRFLKKEQLVHYKGCLTVVKAAAMVVFYIAGNYFVIRESSVKVFRLDLHSGGDIPMALIFYLFTAIVPFIYLYFGLKTKDKLMVLVALILIAISVLTFKYYFNFGHPDITLIIAGIVMILIAYVCIRYLGEGRHGITFKVDPNDDDFLKSNAEALIIANSFGATPSTTSGVELGGGEFGGAGSGGKF